MLRKLAYYWGPQLWYVAALFAFLVSIWFALVGCQTVDRVEVTEDGPEVVCNVNEVDAGFVYKCDDGVTHFKWKRPDGSPSKTGCYFYGGLFQ